MKSRDVHLQAPESFEKLKAFDAPSHMRRGFREPMEFTDHVTTMTCRECTFAQQKQTSLSRTMNQKSRTMNHSTRSFPVLFTFLYVTCMLVSLCSAGSLLWTTFESNEALNHVTVDEQSGKVYVGAVNKIYQLSGNGLSVENTVKTGPRLDHPYCNEFSPNIPTCQHGGGVVTKEEYNTYNKILVLDSKNNNGQLITCGSTFQGTCELRHLTNISISDAIRVDTGTQADLYVAANSELGTSVAFTGKGPNTDHDVLYVGTSYTNHKGTRGDVPLVSSRILSTSIFTQYLKFVSNNDLTAKGTYHKWDAREPEVIDYKAGFGLQGFSYFFTVNKDADSNTFRSKLVSVCQEDSTYASYVEMPLSCSSESIDYNIIQSAAFIKVGDRDNLFNQLADKNYPYIIVAVFAKSESQEKTPTSNSAMCIYDLSMVRDKIRENVQACFNGQYGCFPISLNASKDFCGNELHEDSIIGTIALEARPARTYSDSILTAVNLDTINRYTVGFIGTAEGTLKKVIINGLKSAQEYSSVTVHEGHAIKADMPFAEKRKHLYVMTDHKLSKVPLETCSTSSTCATCKALDDPYCGWCSLERACSRSSQCRNQAQDKRWLSMAAWDCIGIKFWTPNSASISSNQVAINFNIKALPLLQGTTTYKYVCVFGDYPGAPETIASTSVNDITCNTPKKSALPAIDDSSDHVTVDLGIKSTETDIIFLNTNFSFYDCGKHDKCSACTQSAWQCNWCIYDNKCVDKMTTCSAGMSTPVVEDGQSAQCPRLVHLDSEEIIIPVNFPYTITLKAENLPIPNQGQSYECLLHGREPPLRIPAERLDDSTVQCQRKEFSYDMVQETKTENIAVVWGSDYFIEDDNTKAITLYSCEVMGTDCSQCVSIMEHPKTRKYNCRWCDNSCQYNRTCSSAYTTDCPKPQITSVRPLKGPKDGGTLLTIEGSNLGRSFQQVERAVTVAGVPCDTIETLYEISKKIVCKTGASSGEINATVQVHFSDINFKANFTKKFSYQDPKLVDIKPNIGPMAGGTRVTIKGTALDVGDAETVYFNDVPCPVSTPPSATEIVCTTKDVPRPVVKSSVIVWFSEKARRQLVKNFNFTQNPNISSIQPLKSFASGGRMLTISGTNLNSIANPKMVIRRIASNSRNRRQTNNEFVTDCTKKQIDATTYQLECPTPQLTLTAASNQTAAPSGCVPPATDLEDSPVTQAKYTINFIMDGVTEVQNLATYMPSLDSMLTVAPDPVYEKFEGKKDLKGDSLELKGRNLDTACTEKEVQVFIGQEQCEVRTLDATSLFCIPPNEQPAGEKDGDLPMVVVRVGNTCHELGPLEYQVIPPGPPNDIWIIAVAVGGGALIMIIIIILVVYKRKSRQAERQYKKMQMQLDTLESNVRNECKQAFAELQTEVSDFTSDINVIGIPFWDYKTYTFKVLFPSVVDHPVLHSQVTYTTNQFGSLQYNTTSKYGGYDQGLHQFNQLLCSKQFLLIFIRTLEQQKNFSVRDKAQVASLLMIVLQDKMEYATDILKSLLNELIDRSVEKKHPKLMLRRTESVVEKLLTNWLSICMHNYLKKHAGKSLFMLYKAIKHQTEKGPIDAITAESRYSLSEDRLLREKIEPKTLNINLVTDEHREPITCKMLDLDTITQAKEKALDAIYMNTPNTRRPDVHNVDLEWRSGRSGHLPLQDEDVTTEVIAGWKKVNTLAHYHVPDGATMALVQSRNGSDGVRNVNGMIEITSSLSAITPIMTMEEGTKVWHLVKHDDNQLMSRAQKVISEIFLTRLLATKGTLQQFIDDLFMTILRVDSSVPPAIKYLFDFLDQAAKRHNIVDPDVVHTWKSNSLPLRFWVNIIKNPEFVFDVHKSHIVDSCLSVIAQTFMDACSTMEHRLGKDSPSNKLLFAKDIPRYRNWVSKFYRGIQEMAPVSEQEMNTIMMDLSMNHVADFNVTVALRELYKYAQQYNFEFLENLDDDPSAKKLHLANKFEQVAAAVEGTPMY